MWPAPQPTNDNSLTDLQDRKRAPLKHSRRCIGKTHSSTDSSMSETPEVQIYAKTISWHIFTYYENSNLQRHNLVFYFNAAHVAPSST